MAETSSTHHLLHSTYSRRGFSLLEIIVFLGIFSVIIVGFITAFVAVSQIQVRQVSSAEVASQSQFLLQTFQYYIERSSVIEATKDVSSSTVKLRMSSSTEDPVIFSLSNGVVTMSVAGGAAKNLTSSKVSVSSLNFTKRENSPGRDSLAITFNMIYNVANAKIRASQFLNTSLTRVSAATFDSNLLPASGNTYGLGVSAGDWKSINGTINFSGSNVGIGTAAPKTTLDVAGGDIHVSTAGQGIILKASNGTTCLKLTASTTAGVLLTSSVACP